MLFAHKLILQDNRLTHVVFGLGLVEAVVLQIDLRDPLKLFVRLDQQLRINALLVLGLFRLTHLRLLTAAAAVVVDDVVGVGHSRDFGDLKALVDVECEGRSLADFGVELDSLVRVAEQSSQILHDCQPQSDSVSVRSLVVVEGSKHLEEFGLQIFVDSLAGVAH